jgi:hypothetical protein
LQPSASRFSLFEQLSLDWTHEALRLGFRYETYVPSEDSTLEYHRFVRRYATWTGQYFDAAVGNYEAIFGRGLVLRAFELPGVIREEFATPQYGDLRDLDGVRARFHAGRWEAEALQGKPRLANQPPEEPRRGSVEGATASVRFLEAARAGGNYLRLDSQASGQGRGSRPVAASSRSGSIRGSSAPV